MPSIKMKWAVSFEIVEKSVVYDKNFIYTIASYSVILAIFMNLNSLHSPLIGLIASVIYSGINAIFLGNAFFGEENTFFRFMFGFLSLTMLLGFVSWLIMIIYNLDVLRSILVLLITTTLSSLLNRRRKHKNATY